MTSTNIWKEESEKYENENIREHDSNHTIFQKKVLTNLQMFPKLVKNSILGVAYDLKHYKEIPDQKNKSRLQYILTRDSRGTYLFSTLVFIVFFILLISCIIKCCCETSSRHHLHGGYYYMPHPSHSYYSSVLTSI